MKSGKILVSFGNNMYLCIVDSRQPLIRQAVGSVFFIPLGINNKASITSLEWAGLL